MIALIWACKNENIGVIRELIERGANINIDID